MRPVHFRPAIGPRVLLAVYLPLVACIVFSPSDEVTNSSGFVVWVSDHIHQMRDDFPPAYVALEFTANIAMFVPFGILVPLAFARLPWYATLALGFATTLSIELVQSTLPSRFSTVSDVVANTLGAAIGLLVLRRLAQSSAMRRLPNDTVPSSS
jgi:glycopeptide antibiotics resistance protein